MDFLWGKFAFPVVLQHFINLVLREAFVQVDPELPRGFTPNCLECFISDALSPLLAIDFHGHEQILGVVQYALKNGQILAWQQLRDGTTVLLNLRQLRVAHQQLVNEEEVALVDSLEIILASTSLHGAENGLNHFELALPKSVVMDQVHELQDVGRVDTEVLVVLLQALAHSFMRHQ